MDLKKWLLPTTAPPFEKSALPLQNPKSATVIQYHLIILVLLLQHESLYQLNWVLFSTQDQVHVNLLRMYFLKEDVFSSCQQLHDISFLHH